MSDVHAVILAGGSGSRLWPLSRQHLPKQFLSLDGDASPLQATINRLDEKGYDAAGKCIVQGDPRYFRPTEVEALLGDPSKAKQKLGWTTKITFHEMVAEMVHEDIKSAERDELVKKHGFTAYDYHE